MTKPTRQCRVGFSWLLEPVLKPALGLGCGQRARTTDPAGCLALPHQDFYPALRVKPDSQGGSPAAHWQRVLGPSHGQAGAWWRRIRCHRDGSIGGAQMGLVGATLRAEPVWVGRTGSSAM
jgi:hypothetical protein